MLAVAEARARGLKMIAKALSEPVSNYIFVYLANMNMYSFSL